MYDAEYKLYYLQSRYYDPGLGRFNAPDAYASTGQGILGNNMFAYCLNNPVAYSDTSGNAAKSCLSADGRIDDAPWRDASPGGGGRPQANYSSGNDYGSVADKFYIIQAARYLLNTEEQVVLSASFLAFYNGVPVFKLPIGKEAFSLGAFIVLGNDVKDVQTLYHEYGHCIHAQQIGVRKYINYAAIPSFVGYWTGVPYEKYYSQPWEYAADVFGGVNRVNYQYAEASEAIFYLYWIVTILAP